MKTVKTITVLLAIGGLMFASAERVNALGGNAAFWPDDDANISVFPHAINNFNIANTDGSDFFVSWGDDMKFGFTGGASSDFVKLSWGQGNMGVNFGLNMNPSEDAVSNTWMWMDAVTDEDGNVIEAYCMGNNNAGSVAECDNSEAAVDAVNIINASFGMGMGFGDVGVHFNNDAGTHVGAGLRMEQNVWVFSHVLASVGMSMPDAEDDASTEVDESASVMDLSVDAFTHLDIGENTTGLFALGFDWTNQGDGNIHVPAMTFAVESEMTDWATLRAGFTKNWSLTNTESDGVSPTFGLGFNYGSFNLDLNLGTDTSLFTNPVSKITGFSELSETATFNITYLW